MPKSTIIGIKKFTLGGRLYLDIRRYLKVSSGPPIPTSKGLSIPYELSEEILQGMRKANGKIEYVEL